MNSTGNLVRRYAAFQKRGEGRKWHRRFDFILRDHARSVSPMLIRLWRSKLR